MKQYVERLGITLAHDYFGTAPLPLRLLPADPAVFDKRGLILKRRGNRFSVIAEAESAKDMRIKFDVVATDPLMFSITRFADWGRVLQMSVPAGTDELAFGPTLARPDPMRNRLERMAQVVIDLDRSDPRDVTVRFQAIEALWAYHVLGKQIDDDLQVVDPDDRVSFSQQGKSRLPDGRSVRVIRSNVPLPARARPTHKFMLQRPSAFGPETLIPVLPAAGRSFKPIPDKDGAAAGLQSDIYVTLW